MIKLIILVVIILIGWNQLVYGTDDPEEIKKIKNRK
jgi:hypothetical protein